MVNALRADALTRGKYSEGEEHCGRGTVRERYIVGEEHCGGGLGVELDVEGLLVVVVGLDGFFSLLKDGYCKFFAFSFYPDVEGGAERFDLVEFHLVPCFGKAGFEGKRGEAYRGNAK